MKSYVIVSLFVMAGVLGIGVHQSAAQNEDWRIDYHVKEIMELKKMLDEWNPENQYFPSLKSNEDYGAYAISKDSKAAWLKKLNMPSSGKIDTALESLRVSLYKRIPDHKINPRSYLHRNAVEEKLIAATIAPGFKVFKTGFEQSSWVIAKNDYGIPTARYKHGLIYGRHSQSIDPFCRAWYVNVIQDYSGGGTYAETYAKFISQSRVACPAGQ